MSLGKQARRSRRGGALLATLFAAFGCGVVFAPNATALPADRGWELVSPVDKNGGVVAGPGELAGGGVLQAAADGNAVTYGSASSFGPGAQGAPPASQYLGRRSSSGWSTENLTTPILSGTYAEDEGSPYRLFATDLARGLLLNGKHCRGEQGSGCPVANPPLAGTDAPAGFQNYYLHQGAGFEALLGPAELAHADLDASEFSVSFAGASADLNHVVLSTCAALTADAVEVPLGGGCDPAKPNLYKWSAGVLTLINVLPAQTEGTPGAALAAQSAVVSADGSRVYWTDLNTGNLYLRQGTQTRQVDAAAGGGGSFQTASSDGAITYFTKAGHLWRYSATADAATDLTPAGGVLGVLGASADGGSVYFQDAGGLRLWQGTTTTVAPGPAAADAGSYPPTTGTARVSPDGTKLAFLSTASLTGYNNANQKTGIPEPEVFLYDATAAQLRCASCRPTGARPIGPSTIPGSVPNGEGPQATNTYKPRALSADGRYLFFDSRDAIVAADTNNDADVYQWQANGSGNCAKASGCIELISSGRSEDGARFSDASLDGSSAFFLTDGSLVRSDPGAVDLYVARIGGGFPDPLDPIPCNGDSCQFLPSEPVDPALGTLFVGPGNPAVRYHRYKRRGHEKCRRAKADRGGRRCVKAGKGKNKGKGAKGKATTKARQSGKGGGR